MIVGVASYMLLCWGEGVVYTGLVSLTSSSYPSPYSPYSSEHFVLGERGLVCLQGFTVCACA